METDENPLVSVYVPTYNNAEYIGATLESIIRQTYRDIEIVVSDNGSPDHTREVVTEFSDTRIRYFRSENTTSCLANWNRAFQICRADYIAIYHADDVYEPRIVEAELRFLQAHPQAGAVFCLDRIIDERGVLVKDGTKLPAMIQGQETVLFPQLLRALMTRSSSFLMAQTLMIRREVVKDVGGFEESDKFGPSAGSAADLEMWLRLSRVYPLGILPQRLVRRRISRAQGSNQYEERRTTRANHFAVMDFFLGQVPAADLSRSLREEYAFQKFWDNVMIARNFLLLGRRQDARDVLARDRLNLHLAALVRSPRNIAKGLAYAAVWLAARRWLPVSTAQVLKRLHRRLFW